MLIWGGDSARLCTSSLGDKTRSNDSQHDSWCLDSKAFVPCLLLPPLLKVKLFYHSYLMRKLLPWLISFRCNSSKYTTYNNDKKVIYWILWIHQALYSDFYTDGFHLILWTPGLANFSFKGQIVNVLALETRGSLHQESSHHILVGEWVWLGSNKALVTETGIGSSWRQSLPTPAPNQCFPDFALWSISPRINWVCCQNYFWKPWNKPK